MKQQSLEIFSKEETGPYELPKGWRWVRLGEVVTHIQSGFACSKKYETKNGIPHLRPNNIGFNGELDLSKLVHIPAEIVDLTKYSLKKGDVLFNNTNSKELVGRAVLITQDLDYGFSNHITRLRVNKELITPLWMVLTVNYLWLQGYFLKICQKWIGQAGVNTKMLKSIQIPLPPLPEQKRIVARIEELFSKIDEIKRLRKEANDLAKTLLPSALHEVFSKADEKGWKWVRLGDKNIAKIIMGQSPPSTTYNQDRIGLPFYQGKTDFGDLYPSPRIWCSIPNKIAESGDILISVRAPVGPVNMCREKSCIGRGLAAIRPTNQIDNFFLFYYFKYIEGTWTGRGSTFGAIKKRELENLQIPLPPLPEQKRIIAYLDNIQQKAQTLQKFQEETEKEIERLRKVILHKVFRGEL